MSAANRNGVAVVTPRARAFEAWRNSVTALRSEFLARLDELSQFTHEAHLLLLSGKRSEAAAIAVCAADVEYDLTGDTRATTDLFLALGLDLDEASARQQAPANG